MHIELLRTNCVTVNTIIDIEFILLKFLTIYRDIYGLKFHMKHLQNVWKYIYMILAWEPSVYLCLVVNNDFRN